MIKSGSISVAAITATVFLLALIFGLLNMGIAMADGISLRPPYDGTYRLTTFFDHHYPNYAHDNEVTIYTGESVADCSPHCYQGHSGFDWSMYTGTQVLAAYDGVVERFGETADGYGRKVVIRHPNGFRTLYAHLSAFNNLVVDQSVTRGDLIALSGNTGNSSGAHLHFGIYRGPCLRDNGNVYEDNATDPFGWRGTYPDPLLSRPAPGQQHIARCLWRSVDEDPISCADTIVEDDGSGFALSGAWLTSEKGNGFHMYYRRNVTDTSVYANWLSTVAGTGPNKVYAYIPSQNATTYQATYNIWTGSRWETSTVNQQNYTDTWVLLGTYQLLAHYAFVFLYARTGELTDTTWIAADAIKFRSYADYLPVILKVEPTPTSCGFDGC